jgi:hypothetical protein
VFVEELFEAGDYDALLFEELAFELVDAEVPAEVEVLVELGYVVDDTGAADEFEEA